MLSYHDLTKRNQVPILTTLAMLLPLLLLRKLISWNICLSMGQV